MPLNRRTSPSHHAIVVEPTGPSRHTVTPARSIRRRFAVDGRVRSGCLTCKARKKKCHGQSFSLDGRCLACIRLGLVCEQAPLRRVKKSTGTDNGGAADPIDEAIDTTAGNVRNNNGDNSAAAKIQRDRQTPPSETHDRDVSAVSPPSRFPANISSWLPSHGNVEKVLLRYYLDHGASLLSILQQDGSRFSSVLLPMAIVYPPLLHAIYTFAAVRMDAVNAGNEQARLRSENQVARGINEAINANTVTESTLACALVSSTAYVISGDTSRWLVHLQGAGHLVAHLGPPALLRSPDGVFLLRYFAYHNIIAFLTTGDRSSCHLKEEEEPNTTTWSSSILADPHAVVSSADPFMGLAYHIFRHLAAICIFVAENPTDKANLLRHMLRGEDMAHALRLQDLRISIKDDDDHHNIEYLIHHAEAFRFAALFYLYRHLASLTMTTKTQSAAAAGYRLRMQDCVRSILAHVSLVPRGLMCEVGLLFPLFVAGVGAGTTDEGGREYVRDRLRGMEGWSRFGQVGRAGELLLMLWNGRREDWEVVLKEMGWSLSLT